METGARRRDKAPGTGPDTAPKSKSPIEDGADGNPGSTPDAGEASDPENDASDGSDAREPEAKDVAAEKTPAEGARTPDPIAALAVPREVEYVVRTPLLVDRPVRSGQQLYARDTDLIIMGQVGPGAEVIADNNIHVYGPLRGRALCGVSGNADTRIFCQSLEAELVSVAGVYRMLETIPEELRGKPAQIWLDNDRLAIEPL